MSNRISRRRMLQSSAASLGYLFTGPAGSVRKVYGAADTLRVAGIGIGGKGQSDIEQASRVMEVVALCDIDGKRLDDRAKSWPKARTFFDYRKLFDTMAKEIDAVTVSTADHSHAPASILAMKAGKHVYCQKPLTQTVFEANKMREIAAKTGVVTQMGNQGSALNGLRRGVELIHAGVLGAVHEAHVWTNRPAHYWKQSPDITSRPKEVPLPSYVHWEEWTGPAPKRPYASAFPPRPAYHPHDWRGYWDFGTGALGDMACHTTNMAFRALKLGAPIAVQAEAGEINPETYPAWAHIQYIFAARGEMAPCILHWYEGSRNGKRVLPPEELLAKLLKPGEKLADSGSILVGSKGILFSPNDYGAQFRLTPEKDFAGINTTKPEHSPEGTNGDEDAFMKKEWAAAIRAGNPKMASSNFAYSGQLTETMLLGNIAVRFGGQRLEWDGAKLRFANSDAATQLVSKEYRKGWDFVVGA